MLLLRCRVLWCARCGAVRFGCPDFANPSSGASSGGAHVVGRFSHVPRFSSAPDKFLVEQDHKSLDTSTGARVVHTIEARTLVLPGADAKAADAAAEPAEQSVGLTVAVRFKCTAPQESVTTDGKTVSSSTTDAKTVPTAPQAPPAPPLTRVTALSLRCHPSFFPFV